MCCLLSRLYFLHFLLFSYISVFRLSAANVIERSNSPSNPGDPPLQFEKTKLQHLHVLFRHGDRSPIHDVINVHALPGNLWPSGYGQLTDEGVVQEFDLGRWIRSKYGYFIPQNYNASDVHMRSTDVDRTLMSAQAFTAGLYHNSSSPLSPYGIAWRPIPIHTVSQETDILLSVAKCPCLELLRQLQMNSNDAIMFEQEHRALFDAISRNIAIHVDRTNLWTVSDTLICMKAHNMSLPMWCTDEVYQELLDVDQFFWNLKTFSSQAIIRFEIGVFLNDFTERVKYLWSSGDARYPPVQRTMVYSAHDTDVTYLLVGLGVFDRKRIEYSACVILELFGPDKPSTSSDYYLRLLYKRSWNDQDGEYLQFPMCANRSALLGCPLDVISNQIAPLLLTPEQYASACATGSGRYIWYFTNYITSNLLLSLMIIVLLCCLFGIIVFLGLVVFFRFRATRPALEHVRFGQTYPTT